MKKVIGYNINIFLLKKIKKHNQYNLIKKQNKIYNN